jgi:signal transduction histidine kinase
VRDKTLKWPRVGLKGKTIASIIVVGSVPVLLSLGLIYFQGTSELRKAIGASFEGLAKETARKVDLILGKEIDSLHEIAQSFQVQKAVEEANQDYQGLSEKKIKENLALAGKRWSSSQQGHFSKKVFVRVQSAAPLESFLRSMMDNPAYLTVSITDEKGALIASTNQYADYLNATKAWWRMAAQLRGKQPYISDMHFDENAKVYTIDIAMAITGEGNKEPIGVLKREYDVKEFLKSAIFPTRFGKTGHGMLINSAGDVLICPILPTGLHVADVALVSDVTTPRPGWVIAANDAHGGKNSIVGFSPLENYNDLIKPFGGKRWYSFIRQDPKELYVPIQNLMKWIAFSGIMGMGILSVLGFYAANRIVTPIRKLQKWTKLIAEGKLDRQINIRTGDEIEQLGYAFDEMNHKLKEAFSGLEFKVEERTRELKEAQAKLLQVERLTSMGQVAASVGHELRNPLSVIKNSAYYLKMKIKDDPKLVKHLEIQEREIAAAEKIIDDLLTFTHTRELSTALTNVHRVLEDILSVTEVPSGILIEKDFDPQLAPFQFDSDQIRRVFINIIRNAIQAMDTNGKLKITTRMKEEWAEIEFSDTGKGITPENLEKLFRPFFTTKAKGIGLGLAVSKKIIDQHNGRVQVSSEVRNGTTFTISLPIRA